MKLNVFGKKVEIIRNNNEWITYYCGNEGKNRKTHDILLPANLPKAELVEYISDLCHESATLNNNRATAL